ncbi:hypothetical protein [uncultured Paracoccus sp.]|uniref:hypothetical protein n=1 Tax=uncultured Paracoccus sp. TaxID=189685 RepID=UPI00259A0FB8|nr:hypothetical protein [uncultured Paracoccus sp.]
MMPSRTIHPVPAEIIRRRASAEAHEIALRSAHRRADVPVHDFCGDDLDHLESRRFALDDIMCIYGIPEATIDDDAGRLPIAWVNLLIWLCVVVLVLIGFVLGWSAAAVDWRDVLDFIAPTAAQARDAGWVTISEAL